MQVDVECGKYCAPGADADGEGEGAEPPNGDHSHRM